MGVFVGIGHLQAGVVAALFADGRAGPTFIVMGRVDQRRVRQGQQALQAVPLGVGIAVLEIRAAGAADQQGIAAEHAGRFLP
ncbi:hypothetical protein D3C81_2123920 [compost metagenome]